MAAIYGDGDASFQAAGGQVGIRKLVDRFYDVMGELPQAQVIRTMHPGDLTVSRDKLFRFLCGWLGGEKLFAQKYGPIMIPKAHAHLDIKDAERDAWLACMQIAVDEQNYASSFKVYLMEQLFVPAERCRTASQKQRGLSV
ncbi:MAG: group II truncated hemoglobin [Porticoccaceae bacterium]|nr:group II truncated hemoglobin [Porticoccaceae bacterium]